MEAIITAREEFINGFFIRNKIKVRVIEGIKLAVHVALDGSTVGIMAIPELVGLEPVWRNPSLVALAGSEAADRGLLVGCSMFVEYLDVDSPM